MSDKHFILFFVIQNFAAKIDDGRWITFGSPLSHCGLFHYFLCKMLLEFYKLQQL